jgi:hypothetical protein
MTDPKDRGNYFQLFEDSGCEHVRQMNAWQYFRMVQLLGRITRLK